MRNARFNYRIYPTPDQESLLIQSIGCSRYVWNYFLNKEQETYNQTQTFNYYQDNSRDLTQLKKQLDWLRVPPAVALQQTLRNLDKAIRDSLPNTKRKVRLSFPKFKKRRPFSGSFNLAMIDLKSHTDTDNGRFRIPSIGWVKTVYHRPIPSNFKSATIVRDAGEWYVSLVVKIPLVNRTLTGKSVGLDMNSGAHVLSDNIRFDNPRYRRKSQARLKRLKRAVSRKQKNSHNRKKAQLRVSKMEKRIRCKRTDYFHKLSKRLIDDYDIICIEDLNVKAMQQWNGRMIEDNGFGILRQMLQAKAEIYGNQVVVVDRYYPSSKTCSNCGAIHTGLSLHDRIYDCQACGNTIDRDLNAAINIHRAGTAQINASVVANGVPQMVTIGHIIGHDSANEKSLVE